RVRSGGFGLFVAGRHLERGVRVLEPSGCTRKLEGLATVQGVMNERAGGLAVENDGGETVGDGSNAEGVLEPGERLVDAALGFGVNVGVDDAECPFVVVQGEDEVLHRVAETGADAYVPGRGETEIGFGVT